MVSFSLRRFFYAPLFWLPLWIISYRMCVNRTLLGIRFVLRVCRVAQAILLFQSWNETSTQNAASVIETICRGSVCEECMASKMCAGATVIKKNATQAEKRRKCGEEKKRKQHSRMVEREPQRICNSRVFSCNGKQFRLCNAIKIVWDWIRRKFCSRNMAFYARRWYGEL